MSNSAWGEILHDLIAHKNELIKSLRETIENLEAQPMDISVLKPSDTHKYLLTCNDNFSQLNIEEATITTPRLSQNDQTR